MTRVLPPRQDHLDRKLVEWLDGVLGRAHAWGTADCVRLAEEAIGVMIGQDFALDDKPAYDTRAGAGEAVAWAITTYGSIHGYFEANGLVAAGGPRFAQYGDVLIWEPTFEGVPMIGVVVGRNVALVDEAEGVHLVPLIDLLEHEAVLVRVP